MQPVKVIKTAGGKTLNIYRDSSTANPRLSEDVQTRMLFLHERHQLGDSHSFKTPAEVEDYVEGLEGSVVMPVFMLLNTATGYMLLSDTPLNEEPGCTTGQLGLMYVDPELVEEIRFSSDDRETRNLCFSLMEEELETYNEWLNDEVYGYELLDTDGSIMQQETGFFGSDHSQSGLLDDAQVDVYNDGTAEHVSESCISETEEVADEA